MQRASTATLASWLIHDRLALHASLTVGRDSVQHVEFASGGHAENGNSLLTSPTNALGVRHSAAQLQEGCQNVCDDLVSLKCVGKGFRFSGEQHTSDWQCKAVHVQFGGMEEFSDESGRQGLQKTRAVEKDGFWGQVVSNVCRGGRSPGAELGTHSGTLFARAWEQV